MNGFARGFERLLWNSRYIVVVAVVASLIVSVAVFILAGSDVVNVFNYLWAFLHDNGTHEKILRAHVLTAIVEFLDTILFAAIMLIFALGLYELFVGRIAPAEDSEFAGRLLLIRSVDDLKDRLAKVIFLILIVKYFEVAISANWSSPLDLLMLAAGIALIALGLYLTKPKEALKTPS